MTRNLLQKHIKIKVYAIEKIGISFIRASMLCYITIGKHSVTRLTYAATAATSLTDQRIIEPTDTRSSMPAACKEQELTMSLSVEILHAV
ncbi:uncharacterized protein Bfra_009428 [Botrytis fragariae]|uniref:Uncharacterized protein n=1 Tax=Botrytis fragariae TaxID=1964551 RepID=A0A8H6EG31_9HELO|nr:uncharacterized protein Bfra_009428 [Botrytis fragariae]KAF5870873.1 hypothetical protein Bfra_009428 [Botrytis fragariae]